MRAVGAGHNSAAALRAFEHHHGEAERTGRQSLDHRMKASIELWRYRQGFAQGAWGEAEAALSISQSESTRYLRAGEFLASGQNRRIRQPDEFGDFAHLLRVAGDWRAERDAERARQAAQEARDREAEARRQAEEATQARKRERAEQRAEKARARAEQAEEKAVQRAAHVEHRKQAEAHRQQALQVLNGESDAPRYNASRPSSNDWYTPAYVIEAARKAMGGNIDLDPASCEEAQTTVQAARFYTEADNALHHTWEASSVWLNPPYSKGGQESLNHWTEKLMSACEAGHVQQACLLLNANVDTKVAQKVLRHCNAVCVHAGRVKFDGPRSDGKGGMPVGQIIYYFGDRVDIFGRAFFDLGAVLMQWRAEA